MSEDAYEYSGFERNCPEADDGFYLVKNGITYKVDLPMDKTRFTKRINILTGEVYYPSNADRIRAMSDEELAEFLRELTDCVRCTAWDKEKHGDVWNQRPCYTGEIPCKEMWLRWLKQEGE